MEVSKDTVALRRGATMPSPESGLNVFYVFHEAGFSRKEFARWSGVTFPPGNGIYGLRVTLGVIRRYRKVSSEEFVAAKHTKVELKEVK